MKIITNRQEQAIFDIIKEQRDNLKTAADALDKSNAIIKSLKSENDLLKALLHQNGICYSATSVDFPATTKVEKPENKLF